jgi:hypothetical protein
VVGTFRALVQQAGNPMARVLHRLPPHAAQALLRQWLREFDHWHLSLHGINRPLAYILTAEWEAWFLNQFQALEAKRLLREEQL